jgi:hypothetical protein
LLLLFSLASFFGFFFSFLLLLLLLSFSFFAAFSLHLFFCFLSFIFHVLVFSPFLGSVIAVVVSSSTTISLFHFLSILLLQSWVLQLFSSYGFRLLTVLGF